MNIFKSYRGASICTCMLLAKLLMGLPSMAQTDMLLDQTNPALNMPSLAGWHGGLGAQVYYQQTGNDPWNQRQIGVGIDGYVDKWKSGFCLNYAHGNLFKTLYDDYLQLAWSRRFQLGKESYLSSGLSLQFLHKRFKWDHSQYDKPQPEFLTTNEITMGLGISFVRKGFLLSAHSGFISQPNVSFYDNAEVRQARTYTVYAAQRIEISDGLSMTPTAHLIRVDFNTWLFTPAMNIDYRGLMAGGAFRVSNSWSAYLGYEIRECVRLTLSYSETFYSLSFFSPRVEFGVRTLLFRGRADRQLLKDVPVF